MKQINKRREPNYRRARLTAAHILKLKRYREERGPFFSVGVPVDIEESR